MLASMTRVWPEPDLKSTPVVTKTLWVSLGLRKERSQVSPRYPLVVLVFGQTADPDLAVLDYRASGLLSEQQRKIEHLDASLSAQGSTAAVHEASWA